MKILLLAVLLLACSQSVAGPQDDVMTVDRGVVVSGGAGSYRLQGGGTVVVIEIDEMGGFEKLSARSLDSNAAIEVARDVTGLAWIEPELIVYTTSPVYGRPGLFSHDLARHRTVVLVGPVNQTEAYPEGADYFELSGVNLRGRGELRFFYSPDIDEADLSTLRTTAHEFHVHLDGSGLMPSLR